MQTSSQFAPTLTHLLGVKPAAALEHALPSVSTSSPLLEYIAGFASLNYRLSPYPSHTSMPSNPDDRSRNARHPDHIDDVLKALDYLQAEYGFGQRYVLVGHSCGATLAFQVAMSLNGSLSAVAIQPMGIIGVCGIYDMPLLVRNHEHEHVYETFTVSAFGEDETTWSEASPVNGNYARTWKNGKFSMIAHSRDDELVEWAQCDAMKDALAKHRSDDRRQQRVDAVVELSGSHNEVWQDGKQIAECIETMLQELLGP